MNEPPRASEFLKRVAELYGPADCGPEMCERCLLVPGDCRCECEDVMRAAVAFGVVQHHKYTANIARAILKLYEEGRA
jgi:DTW domain-containing protein YfiP